MHMNNDTEITLLSYDYVMDLSETGIISKIGLRCAITDFAILLGGCVSDFNVPGDLTLKGRAGWWWLSSAQPDSSFLNITADGVFWNELSTKRSGGIRPVLPLAVVLGKLDFNRTYDLEVIYGEYPQYAVDTKLEKKLESEFLANRLEKTGKTYTTDSRKWDEYKKFKPISHDEYAYKGKKYVRVKSNVYDEFILSNGMTAHLDDTVWVEVLPIKWYVDKDSKLLISKTLLASGIRFGESYNGNFKNTEMYTFLNTYFKKDVIPSVVVDHDKKTSKIRRTLYNLNFDDVSEEDIIRGNIIGNVPVFLHGQSSEGKSARVKQIDQSCEIIYLRNATPEGLNGKSVYNAETGEMIDIKPTWLKKLEEKCQSEPDKLHVLFFDELTNALPSIQGMAFNIVLDREVNGIWRLPENARIVAAGNEMDDSLAANQLAEPLFNRFAHVNIKTTTENWLKWASVNNIHPAIYAFIAYKGEGVLRSKYDGKKPNADPRKWEMASKVLYATGNPKMLRSLVGEEITREFVAFCNEEVITLEDVINGNYTNEEIDELNTAEKYATTMGLVVVDEDNVEVVRNFAQKLGGEYRAIFDTLWTHNDESRLEKIAILSQDDSVQLVSDTGNDIGNIELTLLKKEEIWGKNSLVVLQKYGTKTAVTDLAIMTGSNYSSAKLYGDDSRGLSGSIFTCSPTDTGGDFVAIVNPNGYSDGYYQDSRCHAIRPVIKSSIVFSEIYPKRFNGFNETYEVEFGEYPQYAVSKKMQIILESAYLRNAIMFTGKIYTFDGRDINEEKDLEFQKEIYQEYEYDGKRYIRFIVKYIHNNDKNILSNNVCYEIGDAVWLEVEPIIWLIDEQTQTLISKRGLISGIKFNDMKFLYSGNFEETEMYKYMNTYLNKEIISSVKQKEMKKILKINK